MSAPDVIDGDGLLALVSTLKATDATKIELTTDFLDLLEDAAHTINHWERHYRQVADEISRRRKASLFDPRGGAA